MIDRKVLRRLGFVEGTGWNHEVWVYEGRFWIHFGEYKRKEYTNDIDSIDGDDVSSELFLEIIVRLFQEFPQS